MKMIYTPNPLEVKVILDENEKEIFKWKYISTMLEDDLYSVDFYLEDGKHFSVEKARSHCSTIERYKNGAILMLEELENSHCGDCIAFPATCPKCYAESILGIENYLPSKYIGYVIDRAFRAINNKNNIQEAIQFLKQNYEESAKYVEYLEAYGKEHYYII